MKGKNYKLLEEIMKVNLHDFVFGDSFLSMTPKHEQQQQEK